MASEVEYTKMTINVQVKFYRTLKAECALKGITMTRFIKEAVREKFNRQRMKNLEQQIEEGEQ